jgi:thiamine-phosphate pyrophosphorylase
MIEPFTAGALRALERAQIRARARDAEAIEPIDLLIALVDEEESRAALLLAEHGIEPARLRQVLGVSDLTAEPASDADPIPQSAELRAVLGDAAIQARSVDRNRSVGTEHLLAGLLQAPAGVIGPLVEAGLALSALLDRLNETIAFETAPLPLASDIPPLELAGPAEAVDLGRILDASANRAREGLRVIEDFVRFALDDAMLTKRLKEVRHRLTEAIRGLDPALLLGSRDTREDVGTHIMEVSEQVRENPRAVLSANFKRIGEALRSLEEYGKLIDVWLAGRFEVLRYDVYTLEKLTMTALASHAALGAARLYVLVGGHPTFNHLNWIVSEALAGGAQVIQLREKGLSDRDLLRNAREVRRLTAQAGARFILNDRPDLARIVGADGVHLGQEDLPIREARRIIGTAALIGLSTHDPAQLEAAVVAGASYLGVGPVFPSATKSFEDFAGLALVRRAAQATTLPWFAIGGIDAENLDAVLEAGARRIAVRSAIVDADRPRQAAAALRARLDALT